MVSPQNLAIAAAAVGMAGREGDIFRKVIGWSLVLLVLMCVIVGLQSTPVLELDGALARHTARGPSRAQRTRSPRSGSGGRNFTAVNDVSLTAAAASTVIIVRSTMSGGDG